MVGVWASSFDWRVSRKRAVCEFHWLSKKSLILSAYHLDGIFGWFVHCRSVTFWVDSRLHFGGNVGYIQGYISGTLNATFRLHFSRSRRRIKLLDSTLLYFPCVADLLVDFRYTEVVTSFVPAQASRSWVNFPSQFICLRFPSQSSLSGAFSACYRKNLSSHFCTNGTALFLTEKTARIEPYHLIRSFGLPLGRGLGNNKHGEYRRQPTTKT